MQMLSDVSHPFAPGLYAICLVDRRTGQVHRVNGAPMSVLTRDPDGAVADLTSRRNPEIWEARVQRIVPGGERR